MTDSTMVTKKAAGSVAEVVERFTGLLDERKITVFAVIDQAAAARNVGQELRDTVLVLFGNPVAGTPVMAAAPLAAVDLPLKVLIWDDGGRTTVTYRDPVAAAVELGAPQEAAAKLGVIHVLTDAITSGQPEGGSAGAAAGTAVGTTAKRRIVTDAFDAWSAGTGYVSSIFAADMTWEIVGHSAASRQYANAAEFIAEVLEPFGARFSKERPFRPVTIRQVVAEGDTVVVLWDGEGETISGTTYRNTYAWSMTLDDHGKIVDGTAFYDSISFNDLWANVVPE